MGGPPCRSPSSLPLPPSALGLTAKNYTLFSCTVVWDTGVVWGTLQRSGYFLPCSLFRRPISCHSLQPILSPPKCTLIRSSSPPSSRSVALSLPLLSRFLPPRRPSSKPGRLKLPRRRRQKRLPRPRRLPQPRRLPRPRRPQLPKRLPRRSSLSQKPCSEGTQLSSTKGTKQARVEPSTQVIIFRNPDSWRVVS